MMAKAARQHQSANSQAKNKKQQVIEKIANFFSNKFAKLFKEKNYTTKQLIADLNAIITDKDLHNFDYSISLVKYEKILLEKLSKMASIDPSSGALDMNKINKLISRPKSVEPAIKQNENVKVNDNVKVNANVNVNPPNKEKEIHPQQEVPGDKKESTALAQAILPIKHDKVEHLKIKAQDEWALIAKLNHEKFLYEENLKKKKDLDTKKLQKEFLENQIKEKEILKQKTKKEEEEFYKIHMENIKKDETAEKMKEIDAKEKMKKQKELMEKMILDSKHQKEEVKSKEKLEDKNIMSQIQSDLVNQDMRLKQKKKEERDGYRKIIKENEEKAELKKVEQEKEKQENAKALEAYTKHIEKQNDERLQFQQKFINQNNIGKANNEINIQKRDELLKMYEEKKLQKEIEEKNNKNNLEEEQRRQKKAELTKEMKNALEAQMKEKTQKKSNIIQSKAKDKTKLHLENEKMEEDQKLSNQKKHEMIQNYKKELDVQLQKKNDLKENFQFMGHAEREINKDLISEIKKKK